MMNNSSILPIFNPIQNQNPSIMRGLVPPTTMANFAPGLPVPTSVGRLGNMLGSGIHSLSAIAGPALTAQAHQLADRVASQATARFGPQLAAAQAAANQFAPQIAAATQVANQLQTINAAPLMQMGPPVQMPLSTGGSESVLMSTKLWLIAVSIVLLLLIIYLMSIGATLNTTGLTIPCSNHGPIGT